MLMSSLRAKATEILILTPTHHIHYRCDAHGLRKKKDFKKGIKEWEERGGGGGGGVVEDNGLREEKSQVEIKR